MRNLSFKQFLTEERHQQVYAYHGTSANYLLSIIKQGLVPNFKNGGYGSEETSLTGVPLTAHPAIYFTLNAKTAEFVSDEFGGHGLLVIAKLSKKSTSIDEDFMLGGEMGKVILNFARSILPIDLNTAVADFLSQVSLPPLTQKSIVPYIKDYLLAQRSYYQAETQGNKLLSDVKQAELALTKKMKAASYYNNNKTTTLKYDGVLGFTGRNKIVGLYLPLENVGWGDLGSINGSEYHKYPTPMKLYNATKEFIARFG